MISREEARLILQDMFNSCIDGYTNLLAEDKKVPAMLIDDINALDMAIEALSQPPADQWIPCSEKLPDEANYYEVTVSYDGLVFTSYSFYSMTESCWCTYPNTITAWRERLPEPYKGVE